MPALHRRICARSLHRAVTIRWRSLYSSAIGRSTDYVDPVPGLDDTIFVAMSGGVDSSFTAHLLSARYRNVVGVYMSNWNQPRTSRKDIPKLISPKISNNPERLRRYMEEEEARRQAEKDGGVLCTETEWNDVQAVCRDLKIPAIRMSFEKQYWTEVFEPMLDGYSNGTTPNPDVTCNRKIKFGTLYEKIERLARHNGQERWWLAMGHYARLAFHKPTGQMHLLRPTDHSKDQTYYLSTVERSRMNNVIFPLYCYTKNEVRRQAELVGLKTAHKPDSQGLCFVQPSVSAEAATKAHLEGKKVSSIARGYSHFRDFLREYIEERPGNIVLLDGSVVGTHPGLWYATVGQRSGLNINFAPGSTAPWYVADKRAESNEIVVVKGNNNPMLYTSSATCDWYWMVEEHERQKIIDLAAKGEILFRYRSLGQLMPVASISSISAGKITITYRDPVHGVTRGQYIALYHGDRVIGSGPVESFELAFPEEVEKLKHQLLKGREQAKSRAQGRELKSKRKRHSTLIEKNTAFL